jgi:hypothetical protein
MNRQLIKFRIGQIALFGLGVVGVYIVLLVATT